MKAATILAKMTEKIVTGRVLTTVQEVCPDAPEVCTVLSNIDKSTQR